MGDKYDQSQKATEGLEKVSLQASQSSTSGVGAQNASSTGHGASLQIQLGSQIVQQLSTQAKGLGNIFDSVAEKLASMNLGEITGVIWDDFEKMSKMQKFMAILGVSIVVGAVGYFSWKHIGEGSWEAIKMSGTTLADALTDKAAQIIRDFDANATLKRLVGSFDKRDGSAKINTGDVTKLWTTLNGLWYGSVIAVMMQQMKKNAIVG